MIRLFIALPLSNKVENNLSAIITDFKTKGGRVKYVDPKNVHLTLKFLGNTDEQLVDQIKQSIDNIGRAFKPVRTTLSKIGAFPDFMKPRVFWIGFEKSVDILENMVSDFENEVEPLGWPKESRKFKPHLTLGRVKENHDLVDIARYAKSYEFDPIDINFDRIVLFKSTLTQHGPIYKRLHEVELAERFG